MASVKLLFRSGTILYHQHVVMLSAVCKTCLFYSSLVLSSSSSSRTGCCHHCVSVRGQSCLTTHPPTPTPLLYYTCTTFTPLLTFVLNTLYFSLPIFHLTQHRVANKYHLDPLTVAIYEMPTQPHFCTTHFASHSQYFTSGHPRARTHSSKYKTWPRSSLVLQTSLSPHNASSKPTQSHKR